MKPSTPWTAMAIAALGAFIVWLSIQMSRTDRADQIVLTIGGCFLLIALAFGLGMVRRRRSRGTSRPGAPRT